MTCGLAWHWPSRKFCSKSKSSRIKEILKSSRKVKNGRERKRKKLTIIQNFLYRRERICCCWCWLSNLQIWANAGLFLFIFVALTLQCKFKLKKPSVDVVPGIRTRGRSIVGADGSTKLWRPLVTIKSFFVPAARPLWHSKEHIVSLPRYAGGLKV